MSCASDEFSDSDDEMRSTQQECDTTSRNGASQATGEQGQGENGSRRREGAPARCLEVAATKSPQEIGDGANCASTRERKHVARPSVPPPPAPNSSQTMSEWYHNQLEESAGNQSESYLSITKVKVKSGETVDLIKSKKMSPEKSRQSVCPTTTHKSPPPRPPPPLSMSRGMESPAVGESQTFSHEPRTSTPVRELAPTNPDKRSTPPPPSIHHDESLCELHDNSHDNLFSRSNGHNSRESSISSNGVCFQDGLHDSSREKIAPAQTAPAAAAIPMSQDSDAEVDKKQDTLTESASVVPETPAKILSHDPENQCDDKQIQVSFGTDSANVDAADLPEDSDNIPPFKEQHSRASSSSENADAADLVSMRSGRTVVRKVYLGKSERQIRSVAEVAQINLERE